MVELWENDWDSEWSCLQTKAAVRVKGGQNQTGETSLRTTTEETWGNTRFPKPSCSCKIIFQSTIHLRLLFFLLFLFLSTDLKFLPLSRIQVWTCSPQNYDSIYMTRCCLVETKNEKNSSNRVSVILAPTEYKNKWSNLVFTFVT